MTKPMPKTMARTVVALASGLALGVPSHPVGAASASGGATVQGLYDVLLGTMKNSRTLGPSGRFTQLEPVIRRTFDIPTMARLSLGPSWRSLTDGQRQQVIESFGRISRRSTPTALTVTPDRNCRSPASSPMLLGSWCAARSSRPMGSR